MPGDPPLVSAAYPVADVVCEDAHFGYWAGLEALWSSDYDLVNIEHDMEYSDLLVAELLSCPHPLCAYPYKVQPFGWPGMTWGASYGSSWVTPENPYASFSPIGFCKISAEARGGSKLERAIWTKVEGSVHKAIVRNRRLWHLHWPGIDHHHDYGAEDQEAGTLYNLIKRARDEGRLEVYGDPLTDECLEKLKAHDPLVYDESVRGHAQALCID